MNRNYKSAKEALNRIVRDALLCTDDPDYPEAQEHRVEILNDKQCVLYALDEGYENWMHYFGDNTTHED